jgi:hypothetical protein
LAFHAPENPALALGRLEPGEFGAHFRGQRCVGSQVDRSASALRVAHHEQKVGSGSSAGPVAPGLRKRSLAGQQRAMHGDEPRDGLAPLVDRNTIFQKRPPQNGPFMARLRPQTDSTKLFSTG